MRIKVKVMFHPWVFRFFPNLILTTQFLALGMSQLKHFLLLQPLHQSVAVLGIAFWATHVFNSYMQ